MNTKTSAIALLITGTLALSACAPMPQPQGPMTTPYPPVVTPPTPPMQPTTPTNPGSVTPSQQYVVQLTASSSASKAESVKSKFAAEGYNAFVSPINVNGKTLHRVQLGMFNSMDDAKAALAQMKSKYPTDPYVAGAITKTP